MSTAKPRLLALDWGTSQLRAYLVGADGSVLAHRDGGPGILAVEPGGFPTALRAFAGDWLAETPCALASGMVGSRQGWHEVPYARCPAGLAELTAGLAEVDAGEGATVQLVPGLTCETDNAIPDVMRGEETQLLGALGERAGQGGGQDGGDGGDETHALLPGTHCKWARVSAGRIQAFTTYMTGELFGLLARHSILARMMDGDEDDPEAFERGVDRGLDGVGLLGRLFSARTLALFDRLDARSVHAYLSGLTIGAEIREALSSARAPGVVTIIGGEALAARYARALARAGVAARTAPSDCAALGLVRIARACQLLEP